VPFRILFCPRPHPPPSRSQSASSSFIISLLHRSAAPTHLLLDWANDLKILIATKSKAVAATEVAASSPQSPARGSEGREEEGSFLLGQLTWEDADRGRWRCAETRHELPEREKEVYARSRACRLALIDNAVAHKKPPLNAFKPHPEHKCVLTYYFCCSSVFYCCLAHAKLGLCELVSEHLPWCSSEGSIAICYCLLVDLLGSKLDYIGFIEGSIAICYCLLVDLLGSELDYIRFIGF
jgi:hypothetical protein